MRIRISDIGPEGLKVHGTIPVTNLNTRMSEGKQTDIVFVGDPRIDITVFSSASGAYTKGVINATVKQLCGWCAEDVEREIDISADFIFQRRDLEETTEYLGETDTYFDDVGINYFTGDHIDIEDVVQEALILTLSPFWRPPQKEDGSCSICGSVVRINSTATTEKTSFGQLLKNAGVRRNLN